MAKKYIKCRADFNIVEDKSTDLGAEETGPCVAHHCVSRKTMGLGQGDARGETVDLGLPPTDGKRDGCEEQAIQRHIFSPNASSTLDYYSKTLPLVAAA